LALYEDFPKKRYFNSELLAVFSFFSHSNRKALSPLVIVDSSSSAAGLSCCLALGFPQFYSETLLYSFTKETFKYLIAK